jgi:hypothetical protein
MAVPLSNDFGAMDLPKGIVEDDVRIYEVFASQPEIPLAALIAMWKSKAKRLPVRASIPC